MKLDKVQALAYNTVSMKKYILALLLITFSLSGFADTVSVQFDIEAHRGGRDRRPENTIPAFKYAIKLGVTTLELDTAVTKDRVVVVSHNPKLNHAITHDENGTFISSESSIF